MINNQNANIKNMLHFDLKTVTAGADVISSGKKTRLRAANTKAQSSLSVR